MHAVYKSAGKHVIYVVIFVNVWLSCRFPQRTDPDSNLDTNKSIILLHDTNTLMTLATAQASAYRDRHSNYHHKDVGRIV